jgi:PleD family two-component response regulator
MVTAKPIEISKFSFETFLNPEGSPLILVVDDDALTRTMVCLAMATEGYQVIEACNTQQCLEAYKIFHPDLVLLDAVMPGRDGFACCRELRSLPERKRPPIIMITCLNDAESVEQGLAAGATDYITKPIPVALLRQRVRRLFQQFELRGQLQQLNTELERQVQESAFPSL